MKDRIKQLIDVDWQNLRAIQPEDVKIQNNLDALKASLKKHGFSLPFAVWIDGTDIYTIDGHTRKKALQELQAEGVEIPDKLKAFEIEAKNRKEAVEILVEVFNQKHNPFDEDKLIEWLEVENVDVEFYDINMKKKKEKEEDGEMRFSQELDIESNYIVLTFKNDIDFLHAKTLFELKSSHAKRQNGKPWSKGIGRVIDGIEAINKVKM